ncbi:MAG TPA: biotin/lipoyl-containing protein [Gemmatimonadales bacterium]|jgi:pyruvate carboxylase subunit B|nr:biotin/lipoyl-containing protein [Gemmatimonadales bacterium]
MKYFVTIAGREIEVDVDGENVRLDGETLQVSLRHRPGTPLWQLTLNGRASDVMLRSLGRGRWTAGMGGEQVELEVIDERTRHIRSLTVGAEQPAGGEVIRAPMPGLVVRVLVEPGAPVAGGSGVLVLEAMKMENELRASTAGVVHAVRVEPGQAVERGQVLVEFE